MKNSKKVILLAFYYDTIHLSWRQMKIHIRWKSICWRKRTFIAWRLLIILKVLNLIILINPNKLLYKIFYIILRWSICLSFDINILSRIIDILKIPTLCSWWSTYWLYNIFILIILCSHIYRRGFGLLEKFSWKKDIFLSHL